VLLNRLEHRLWTDLHVAHHFREKIPLDLREGQKYVLIGKERMIQPSGFFEGTVDDALGGAGDFAWCDVEILYLHGALRF
jgi:hypothetical protein